VKQKNPPQRRAVALEYDGQHAPVVTASGAALEADEIIKIAQRYGIPIQENTALVDVLRGLALGSEIPRELYVAIAEILSFAYLLSGKITPDSNSPGSTDNNDENNA